MLLVDSSIKHREKIILLRKASRGSDHDCEHMITAKPLRIGYPPDPTTASRSFSPCLIHQLDGLAARNPARSVLWAPWDAQQGPCFLKFHHPNLLRICCCPTEQPKSTRVLIPPRDIHIYSNLFTIQSLKIWLPIISHQKSQGASLPVTNLEYIAKLAGHSPRFSLENLCHDPLPVGRVIFISSCRFELEGVLIGAGMSGSTLTNQLKPPSSCPFFRVSDHQPS